MKHQNLTQVSCQALMVSLLIGCLLFGGTRLTGNASAPTPSATVRAAQDKGRIAFVLDISVPRGSGNLQIYVINADGSGLRRLTNNGRTNSDPAWSPDGRQLAFVSDVAEYSTIEVMDADGSNERQLADNPLDHIAGLSWSPDGKSLVFGSDRHRIDEHEYAIYLLDLAVLSVRRLTYGSTAYYHPAWSPTGNVIAIVSFIENNQIYIINTDGSDARLITGRDSSWAPAWSPDGQRIAYTGDENNGSVVVVNRDGSGKKYLALDKEGRYPTWSPDGKSIAFASGFDGTMYIMDADGTNLRRVPNTTGREISLTWRPSR